MKHIVIVLAAGVFIGVIGWASGVEKCRPAASDWLVVQGKTGAGVQVRPETNEIVLTNGLVSRTFRTAPNFATVDYVNLMTGATVIRGVKPEAMIHLDGVRLEVGGLKGQPDYAYLDPNWPAEMTSDPEAFQYAGHTFGKPEAPYPWKPKHGAPEAAWPPAGVTLTVDFRPPVNAERKIAGLRVSVHYELYDDIPLLAKWVSIENTGSHETVIEGLETEVLAVTEQEKHRIHMESDYAFAGMETTHWGPDAEYKSQIDYRYQMQVLLTSKYPLGPGVRLEKGERFESFRTFELLHDSDDRERRGLARRRMYRTLAPQAAENPVLMHVRKSDSATIRSAVDQCAEVGFEMVIITFWSGFQIESEDPEYIARLKADTDYAHGKGIKLGGYTLMCASRNVSEEHNCISPETGEPGSKFGQSACLAGEWADGYFRRVFNFLDATGMDVIETDGPYHGDVCASAKHKYHQGLADSQLRQWEACSRFYRQCRERGIYINTPDWYYLRGSNKCAMGYRESNWSLPRQRQILIARQNIYDGTFEKTPSMGWMFVPLVEYQGGGAAATLEPLSEHLAEYEWHLAQNFGSGVQACYRGPRLYDTDRTKAVVKKWVDFYKKYRRILDSDIIHVRRPDGRSIDCILHVNPRIKPCGLAMVYNPTDRNVDTMLRLPLYYTGLTHAAQIREKEGEPADCELDRHYNVDVPVSMGPDSITWFVVQ